MGVDRASRVTQFVFDQHNARASWSVPPKPQHALRVVTWNLHQQSGAHGDLLTTDDCWRLLHKLDSDVVCLQEVQHAFPLLTYQTQLNAEGVVLACAWPLTRVETVRLGVDRVLVAATTTLRNGRQVRLGATHLEPYEPREQRKQLEKMPRDVQLLGGDFNTSTAPAYLPWLTADGNRKPTCWFGTRIDMVLHDRRVLEPLDCFVVPSTLSDHVPVVADYSL